MHFKPQFHTPNKKIDKLAGVNRPNSFVTNTPEPPKKSDGEKVTKPEVTNKLEQVESLDGASRGETPYGGGVNGAKHAE